MEKSTEVEEHAGMSRLRCLELLESFHGLARMHSPWHLYGLCRAVPALLAKRRR